MNDGAQFAQINKRLRTSSAVVPALILTGICTPSGLIALRFYSHPMALFCAVLAFLPPLLAIGQIVFFTFFDRDRLQNEEHVERKMMIARGIGDSSGIILNPVQNPITLNPSAEGGVNV